MNTGSNGAGGIEIKKSNPLKAWFPAIVVVLSMVIAFVVFYTIFASPDNFDGGDPIKGHPLNFFGTVYKGGFVIPIGIGLHLMLWVFFIERLITVFFLAKGRSSLDVFVQNVRLKLNSGDIDGALASCDRQKGSVANVVKAGLIRYKAVEANPDTDKDVNREAIQKELEEATSLELPMLERNLPFLATIASVGVLIGLFGTVLGMIKAFQALSTAGAPDASALATGISEALVNTALGIGTSALAIIFYNFFTTTIDSLTYRIDEAGYSIVQTYETTHH
ncbi:MAG TPA: MotA/TolQ/ExbB proton channel family protein [Bacteroidetes bacterium]|nr:MotA/TolQ/ExbB proton channel family protein [Bacteroidota bacterium]